jgi:hypothetical protein
MSPESSGECSQGPRELEMCPNCSSDFVYPEYWTEEGPRHWRVSLKCGECEYTEVGVFSQNEIENFDNALDRFNADVLADLRRITRSNMLEETDFFVRVLEADIVTADDFQTPQKRQSA